MSLKFTVVDAFTNKPFGGNPAAVIVLPPNHQYPDSVLQGIASEFNLSETAFISHLQSTPSSNGNGSGNSDRTSDHVLFGLRWFTPVKEVLLCGHATLGSAAVLFADPTLVPQGTDIIHFSTLSGILKAKRVSNNGVNKFELEFPAGEITQAEPQLTQKVTKVVRQATGKDDLGVNFVGVCNVDPYKTKVLVDIDSKVNLQSLKVDSGVLSAGIPEHTTTVITNQKLEGNGFNVRVFAASIGIPEDPVTGSASSFASRYWATKGNFQAGEEMAISQVSARIGQIGVMWSESTATAKLRGEARVASRGEIYV